MFLAIFKDVILMLGNKFFTSQKIYFSNLNKKKEAVFHLKFSFYSESL